MEKKFKGGPIYLNSGGQGPDDYLLKPVKGGRWTLVIFRWGRNWTGREVGKDEANRLAQLDHEAMKEILSSCERLCVPDMGGRYQRMRKQDKVTPMPATEFLIKYK